MAAPRGVHIFSLKRPKYISYFCTRYTCAFKDKFLMPLDLFGVRFKSSRRKKTHHFSPVFGEDYEVHRSTSRVYADVDYNSLRENSQRLRKLRNDYFTRASQAYSRGQRSLAHILSQKGRMMNSAIKHSEVQSSERILKIVNLEYRNRVPSCSRTLNVHGLHVREAISAVEEFLCFNKDKKGRIRIITGWGRNSYPHEVRLLPALKYFLEVDGKRFEEVRPGVIEVIN